MLRTRITTAILGIPLLLGALYLGGFVFSLTIAAIIFLALSEFYNLFPSKEIHPNSGLGIFFGTLLPVFALYFAISSIVGWLVLGVVLLLLWKVSMHPRVTFLEVSITLVGLLYVGLFLTHLIFLYRLPDGSFLVLYTFLATWIADTAAYGLGSWLGQRPLAPKISPNKTVEGLFGAIILNLLIFSFLPLPFLNWFRKGVFVLALTLSGALGDLVESALKRELGVKDTSSILPGHGGILDRFDSLLFTSVTGYYLVKVFLR